MSILSSMYSAAAGLGAHGDAIGVVGDNIANVNTIGFKASRGRFEDVLGSTVAGGALGNTPGQGSRLAGIEQMFKQGALLGTGVATDLAIQGNGFFIVRGTFQGVDGTFYTRAGQFHLDANGQLVNPQGLMVQGYAADALGNIGSALTDLVIPPTASVPPRATTRADIAANLDAAATIPPAFDPANPTATSNFSTSTTVYDSLGESHNVDIYFRQSAAGTWEWHALVDGGELAGGTPGTATEIANGNLTFTTDGRLDTEVVNVSTADFVGATPGQSVAFDFGDSITTDGGTGMQGSTGYASPFNVTSLNQDGYASGALAGITVAENGTITGTFTNGERRTLAQVAMARFRNEEGLLRAGAGLYVDSQASGQALIGAAGSGGRGSIASGSLEQSTVDLAQEFVNLIAYQRGFQANSRTVKTADEMLTELVNMTR
jgi:flagellar hook protein FlgE